ncbi:MAG: hypothetical protein MRY78_20605, partial [Saprospiraceae bacterium]|nr:hypothetical protein [Saprospiraceae bacterium]
MNRTFYFAIFLLFSPCLFAQQFDFQNYSVGAGLAQSQVYALCQDQHGYIWMGTRGGGLSRFDGIRFEQFTQRDGLASNYVNTILEDQTGRIWIGCSDGLSCYDNRKLKSNTLKGISVLDLTQVSDTLFIGTNKGLWMKYDTLPPKQLPRLKDYTVRALYYAQDSSLWLATNQGPIELKKGKTRLLKRKNGFYNPEVMGFVETPNGELWMALFGTGVVVMDSSRQRITNYRPEIGSRLVQTLYLDRKKRIWAGTQDNGLALFNTADSSFTYLSESDGLAKNDVRTIIEDNWRNIWIGTSGGGVSKYAGQLFEHYDESNGLPEDYIYSVAADSAGQLWVSSYDEGFTILTDTAMVPVNAENGFLDVKVKAMFRDRENRMWIGTEGSGLALKDSSGFRFFQTRDGLAGNWIRTITQDQDGHTWVGSASGGLTELVPKDSSLYEFELQVYRKRDGLPGQNINDLEVDSLNRLWIGLRSDGLACLQNGKVVHTLKNALPSVYVRSITEDAFGYLWVGMADAGIARVDIYSDSIEVLAFDGLTSNNVYLLQLDEDQNLWVGSERGVDLVQFDEER